MHALYGSYATRHLNSTQTESTVIKATGWRTRSNQEAFDGLKSWLNKGLPYEVYLIAY